MKQAGYVGVFGCECACAQVRVWPGHPESPGDEARERGQFGHHESPQEEALGDNLSRLWNGG